MSRYNFEKKLPSIRLELNLLLQLEEYIKSKFKEIVRLKLSNGEEITDKNFSLKIITKYGRETFESAKNYKNDYFPNDIKELELSIKLYSPFLFNIELTFTSSFLDSSHIKLEYEDDSSRVIIAGIYSEIIHILKPYKNINYLTHNWFLFSALIMGLVLAPVVINNILQNNVLGYLSWLLLLIYLFSIPLLFFNPYTIFKTSRNEKIKKWNSFLILGFISFLIFGILATYLRKKIFGF